MGKWSWFYLLLSTISLEICWVKINMECKLLTQQHICVVQRKSIGFKTSLSKVGLVTELVPHCRDLEPTVRDFYKTVVPVAHEAYLSRMPSSTWYVYCGISSAKLSDLGTKLYPFGSCECEYLLGMQSRIVVRFSNHLPNSTYFPHFITYQVPINMQFWGSLFYWHIYQFLSRYNSPD